MTRLVTRLVVPVLLALPPAACAQSLGRVPGTERVGDVVYRVRVRVGPDSVVAAIGAGLPDPRLQAAVTVTNVGDRSVSLGRWPNCFFTALELWPVAAAGRRPAWDEERWRVELKRATGIIVECDFAGGLQERELAAGASATFERDASSPWVRDVLGDSLPAGRYRAALRVRPHTAARDAPPTLRLAAGEVVLASRTARRGRPGRD